MLRTPMFFAAMPQTFLDKFRALKLDPASGKPDPSRYAVFVISRRDTANQIHFLGTFNPPPS